jgi:hypothetical protein
LPRPARASYRFFEFFTAQIRNPNTRRAYARAAVEFLDWLAARGVTQITAIESVHVAAYVEQLQKARSAQTAKIAPGRLAPFVRLDGDRPGQADQSLERRARAAPCCAARQDRKPFQYNRRLRGTQYRNPRGDAQTRPNGAYDATVTQTRSVEHHTGDLARVPHCWSWS